MADDRFIRVTLTMLQLVSILLTFLTAEVSDFAQKHLFVMRFMLIFIHTLILIYILITILSPPVHSPHILLFTVFIMILMTYACVLLVSIISTIAASIICISWILAIFTVLEQLEPRPRS